MKKKHTLRKNMTRAAALCLALSLLFTLCVSCGGEQDAQSSPSPSQSPSASPSPSAAPSPSASPSPSVEPSPSPSPTPELPKPTVATLAMCGDMMTHLPITNDAWNAETQVHDYYRMMECAVPYVSAADYAVVNLETTLSGGPNYSGYPAFNAPDSLAYDLKEAGFDLCLTANNHSMDRGANGLRRTLDVLDEVGLAHVGTSRTQEEFDNNCYVADVGGISVAFLGYTYGTNAIPVPDSSPYIINLFNTDYMTTLANADYEKLASDMEKARATGADMIAVMIHWGWEYQTKQSAYQNEMADFFIAQGADMVLGGHSHVPQPMEMRTVSDGQGNSYEGFVCFSLGNFISSQNDPLTDTTGVLTMELTRDNVTNEAKVTGYSYVPMFMLDREEGASPRFELLDAHVELENEETSDYLAGRLEKAISDCHRIWGEAYDSLTPVKPEEIVQTGTGSTNDLDLNHQEFTISDKYPNPVQLRATGASGAVKWESSDPNVASVSSNGLVTRVGKGKCTVTATDAQGDMDTCIVWCT